MVNKNQQDANAQVRERIMKLRIGEMARTTISLPQASERVLQERVDAAVREERLRVQEIERRSVKFLLRMTINKPLSW